MIVLNAEIEERRAYHAKWQRENKEKVIAYRRENRDRAAAAMREYRKKNHERMLEYERTYREKHKDRYSQQWKERYARDKEKIVSRTVARNRERRQNEPDFMMIDRLRGRAKDFLTGSKRHSYSKLIGCERDHLVAYLGSQFKDGMSWENRSSWQIDHIYPLTAVDLNDDLEVRAAFNWRNLRPEWPADNIRKRNKVTKEAKALLESIKKILSTPEE
jgi:hypothetical protein